MWLRPLVVNYKRLSETAILPTYGSKEAAGMDLYADGPGYVIEPGETVKISTGIAISLPQYTFGALFARSGLATKQGLRPANCVGVIDSDYRGEIIVAMHNDSNETRTIGYGDRIAQLAILPYYDVVFYEVPSLDDTDRGDGGFGSTGVQLDSSN